MRSERFAASEADGITDEAAAELRHRIDAYARRMAPTRFFVELSALVIWLGILISSIRIDADDVEPDGCGGRRRRSRSTSESSRPNARRAPRVSAATS